MWKRNSLMRWGSGIVLPFPPADSEYLHSWDSEETPKFIRVEVMGNLCKVCFPHAEAENQRADIGNNTVEMKSNIYPALTLGFFPRFSPA